MMGVDLYIEVSSKRIKPGKASFCYVLEYISPAGNTYTKSEIGCIEASGNRLVLSAVIRALGHLKPGYCRPIRLVGRTKLHVYTRKKTERCIAAGWKQNEPDETDRRQLIYIKLAAI